MTEYINGGGGLISQEEFQVTRADTPPLPSRGGTQLPLTCGLTSFPEHAMRERRAPLQWRNLTNATSARISRSSQQCKSWRQCAPLKQCNENGILPLWSPTPKHTTPVYNQEKNIRQTPAGGGDHRGVLVSILQYLTDTPQNCQSHGKQGKYEKLSPSKKKKA